MKTLRTVVLITLACTLAYAQNNGEHWVATWASAQLATNIPPAAAAPTTPPPAANGAPTPAPAKPAPLRSFNNQTVRMVVNPSIAGRTIRVELSNTFGTGRLKIGSAHVALRDKGPAIMPASDRALTFSGNPTAIIPAGAVVVSDPLDFAVPALGDVVVSVYLPEDSGPPTQHATGLHTTYISTSGNFAAQADFTPERTTNSWYFLSAIHVLASADTRAIVTFGDSITDGATSTNDTNASWPSGLARRLNAAGMKNLAVINEGISGNRVVRDNSGPNALARFDRDVLAQPGVKFVIVMEGINDIGQGSRDGAAPDAAVTSDELIAAYRQMAARAHERGIKVFGATLTPYEGAAYYSAAGEVMRSAVNNWIRTSKDLDGFLDFDVATRDPDRLKQFREGYNVRDHLHPNDAGYKAMAESIDLGLFK